MLCVPAAACAAGAGRGRARRAPARPWSAPAGSPRPAERGATTRPRSPAVAAGTGIRAARARTPPASSLPPRGLTASFVPGRRPRSGRAASPSSRPAAGSTTRSRSCSPRPASASASRSGSGNAVDVTARRRARPPRRRRRHHGGRPARRVGRRRATAGRRPCARLSAGQVRSSRSWSAATTSAAFARSHTGALATSWRTTRAALRAGRRGARRRRARAGRRGRRAVDHRACPPPPTPGSASSPPRPGPGCCCSTTCAGAARPVPELTASDAGRARHAAAAADLPGQPGRHRPPRPRRSARCSPPSPTTRPSTSSRSTPCSSPTRRPRSPPWTRRRSVAASRSSVGVGGSGGPRDGHARGAPRARASRRSATRAAWPRRSGRCVAGRPRAHAAGPARHRGLRSRRRPCRPARSTRTRPRRCSTGSASRPRPGGAAPTAAEAHRALAELGGPVAVKMLDAEVLHKTDVGGVHLGRPHARPSSTPPSTRSTRSAPAGTWSRRWRPPASTWSSAPAATRSSGRSCCSGSAAPPPRRSPTSRSGSPRSTRAEAAGDARRPGGRALLDGWRGGPVARPRRARARSSPRSATCSSPTPTSRRSRSTRCASPPTGSSRSTPSILTRSRPRSRMAHPDR